MFEFGDLLDKKKVLQGRVITDFDGFTSSAQIVFSHSPFWIQIHDMPLLCMNREVGQKIGNSLGEVLAIDVAGDGVGLGHSLRVQFILDITKLLEQG